MLDGDIGFRKLRAFHAVYETRSVTAAAKILGVTQPAVSSLLSRLEQDTGLRLFIREGGTLRPSPEARDLYVRVGEVIAGLRNVQSTFQALRKGTGGHLSVAAQPLVGLSILPTVVARFRKRHPGVVLRLQTTTSVGVGAALYGGMYDIGIATAPFDAASARIQSFRAPCVAIMPLNSPLATHTTITPQLLDGVPFVSMMPVRFVHHLLERAFDEAGATWNVVCETDFFAAAAGLVASTDCVSVVDPFTADQFAAQVAVRPFAPEIHYVFSMYRHPERALRPVVQDFVDVFCAVVNERLGDAANL